MVGHGGSSAGLYLVDPTSPTPSHCASIVVTSTARVNTSVCFSRVCYLLLLLTSSGVLASSLVMAVLRYFDYPTTASFTVDYRRNATFPSITVCNNNQVNVCVQSQTGHALAQGQRNQGQPAVHKILVHKNDTAWFHTGSDSRSFCNILA